MDPPVHPRPKPLSTGMRTSRMRHLFLVLVLGVSIAVPAAEVPPLKVAAGEMVQDISCASDPSQTYTLYLPPSFTGDRQWPVLLVFDPRGRSVLAAELFREAADTYGWILVSSDNTRSDGPWEPNAKAIAALWPEVHDRLPADFDRIYLAGFSGGGAVAYVLSGTTREVAGILACGARHFPDRLKGNDVPIFATAGDTDFNYHEMHDVDEFLGKQGNPHRLSIFEGGHTWMTPEVSLEAVEWFELLAMRSELRDRDPKLVETLYEADLSAARRLESEDRLIDAARRFNEMGRTYDGLRDTAEVRAAAKKIEGSPEFRRQRKEQKRWDDFERQYLGEMNLQFAELRNAEIIPPLAQMARLFRIEELQRRALEPGVEGVIARRALNSLVTGLGFYLPRDFMAEEQYDRLAASLELALTVNDENPVAWYNLACARARLDRGEPALEALSTALDLGFNNTELLATDPDLDSLRDRDDFKAVMASLAE
jgi:predicted esterase